MSWWKMLVGWFSGSESVAVEAVPAELVAAESVADPTEVEPVEGESSEPEGASSAFVSAVAAPSLGSPTPPVPAPVDAEPVPAPVPAQPAPASPRKPNLPSPQSPPGVMFAAEPKTVLQPGDSFGDLVGAWARGREDRAAWEALWEHCVTLGSKARPTKTWRKKVAPLVKAVEFTEHAGPWFASVAAHGLQSENDAVLRGLIWATVDPELAGVLGGLAERSYKKVPGFGAANVKVANTSVLVLGTLGPKGIAQLTRLQAKARYNTARQRIDTALQGAATAQGISREEVEELGVPDFDIPASGTRTHLLAGCEAHLSADPPQLSWIGSRGKPVKSVPKAVKEGDPVGLKALKAEFKELQQASEGQRYRIERLYLSGRSLRWEDFQARYLAHPVVGFHAKRLLWWIGDTVALGDTAIGGEAVDAGPDTLVRLFHPLGVDPELLAVWRDLLEERGIEQPFSQAWREVYQDTPPDAFADRLLRQRRLSDLSQRQGWTYATQGHWDGHNNPFKTVGETEIELGTSPLDHHGDDVIYTYLRTHDVTFVGAPTPLLRSELLREVDLMTTAAAAEKPPPGPFQSRVPWWEGIAFGELSVMGCTRRDVLRRILPRLSGLSAQIEDRWLVVGDRRIHLGSGHPQGDPIEVTTKAKNAAKKVVLPFEGDPLLATILAKAFAVA